MLKKEGDTAKVALTIDTKRNGYFFLCLNLLATYKKYRMKKIKEKWVYFCDLIGLLNSHHVIL